METEPRVRNRRTGAGRHPDSTVELFNILASGDTNQYRVAPGFMLTTQNPDPTARKPFVLFRPFIALWNWLVPPSQAHADRQSRIARFVAAGLAVVISLSAVIFVTMNARSWHGAWKKWRSTKIVNDALKFEKQAGDYQDQMRSSGSSDEQDAMLRAYKTAHDKAVEAYQKDPDNPEAIRLVARIYTRMGRNEARYFWDRLKKLGAMSEDDVSWHAQALARLGEDKAASEQVETLFGGGEVSRKTVETADQVMRNLGRAKQLLAMLREYCKKHPDDLETHLLLGVRLLQFGSNTEQREGLAVLWKLADSGKEEGLRAIEVVDAIGNLDAADQKHLLDRLQHHPLVKEQHRIAALKRIALSKPEEKKRILKEAVEAHRDSKREDMVPLARWLFDEQEGALLLDLLKEDKVIDYPQLLGEYLNALTLEKRYDDLERVLKDPRTRFTPAQKDFFQVHLAFVKNTLVGSEEDKFEKLLSNAVASAIHESQAGMLLDLGRYAEARQHFRSANEAYGFAARSISTERTAYEGLLRVSYITGNTKEFAQTARTTSTRWPDNQSFTERFLYACLLGGTEIETCTERARKLLEARPNDTQRKLIMALSYYRLGDSDAVTKTLQNSNLDDLSNGQRAVFCGLTRVVGFADQALSLAKHVEDNKPMLPEEQRFLRLARNASAAR